MRALRWAALVLLVLAAVAFGRFFLEGQESTALRTEIALLRQEEKRVAELRAERDRLNATKVSDAELQRLRSDRAALVRLRGEIQQLESNADRFAKSIQEPAPAKAAKERLILSVSSEGGLALDDAPIDQTSLRQQLASRGGNTQWVEVYLRVAAAKISADRIKATMNAISDLGKEVGVTVSFRVDGSSR